MVTLFKICFAPSIYVVQLPGLPVMGFSGCARLWVLQVGGLCGGQISLQNSGYRHCVQGDILHDIEYLSLNFVQNRAGACGLGREVDVQTCIQETHSWSWQFFSSSCLLASWTLLMMEKTPHTGMCWMQPRLWSSTYTAVAVPKHVAYVWTVRLLILSCTSQMWHHIGGVLIYIFEKGCENKPRRRNKPK